MDPIFVPLLIIIGICALMVWVAMRNIKKHNQMAEKHNRFGKGYRTTRQRYIPGQFSDQMELDMRLPYRRFRQLYPESRWTYEEYKKMQTQSAFRRSFSSQDNTRMVR